MSTLCSFRRGPDGIYRCDAFEQFMWLSHGFGTREANPSPVITLRQLHSANVVNAAGLKDREQEGDALITDEIGTAVGVRTADCVPILLLDSERRVVAAVHAGWRGTLKEIARRTLEKAATDFGTRPENVYVAIGPSIRECCYRVGPDVAEQFRSQFPKWKPDTVPASLDLVEANRRQLIAGGVQADYIFDCGLCTNCLSADFFSFRREPDNPGRMTAAIQRLA